MLLNSTIPQPQLTTQTRDPNPELEYWRQSEIKFSHKLKEDNKK